MHGPIVKIEITVQELEALRTLRDVVREVDEAGEGIVSQEDPRRGGVVQALAMLEALR